MNSNTNPSSDLVSQLPLYQQQQFTGRLDIRTATHRNWSLYLSLGFLVWARGGMHSNRRWRRQLLACGAKTRSQPIIIREDDEFECWDYHALTLLAQRQVLNKQQVNAIIQGTIHEVLFDIVLVTACQTPVQIKSVVGVRPSHSKTSILRRDLTLETNTAIEITNAQVKQWQQYQLTSYLPDLAPRILRPQQLQRTVTPHTYQKLIRLLTGGQTLRDLAVLLKQTPLKLTRSLSSFIHATLVGLEEIPDLGLPYQIRLTDKDKDNNRSSTQLDRKLAICVEDNPRDATRLESLLAEHNYECHTIQNVIHALPTLLQHEPDFIFLDLVMPIVNGYELCGQIRRIKKFQNTPIIIVTGRDSIVDRVRSKVVGATDFVSKPLDAEKLIGILNKYGHSPAL